MTTQIYIECFIAGILGILFHIFVIKLPALKTASNAANRPFSVVCYFKDDWVSISGSFLSIIISVFLIDNLLKYQPAVQPYLKFLFLFIGYTGSSILQSILSKTGDSINKIVDQKTNELDSIKNSSNQ